jgi:hypothetical protein
MFHPFAHALKNPFRVQQAWRDYAIVVWWGKAKNISVEDETAAQTSAKWVPIDPNYSGERPAVWIKS